MRIDLIVSSLKLAWSESAYTGLLPAANIYYDRAQQPAGVAGFPYARVFVEETNREVMTVIEDGGNSLVTYTLTVEVWTCQGMTGGSGDQITDQGHLVRSLESVLNFLPPNTPWNYVPGFLHCLKVPPGTLGKDNELYLGKDVYKSRNQWSLLISE